LGELQILIQAVSTHTHAHRPHPAKAIDRQQQDVCMFVGIQLILRACSSMFSNNTALLPRNDVSEAMQDLRESQVVYLKVIYTNDVAQLMTGIVGIGQKGERGDSGLSGFFGPKGRLRDEVDGCTIVVVVVMQENQVSMASLA